jgi:uncharacterized protein (DUF1684 family)
MTLSRYPRLGFCLFATSFFLIFSVGANNAAIEDQGEWLKSVHQAWTEEDSEYKNSATSPLAGTQRIEIEESSTVYLAKEDGQASLSLDQADQRVFSLARSDDQWQWNRLDVEVSLMRADEEMPCGSALASGDKIKVDHLTVQVYPSGEKVIALVFDPNTRRRGDFETLNRFEPNPEFLVNAKIERFETPERLDLVTERQQFKKLYRYARMHFEISGEELGLTAYKYALEGEGSNELFVPFTDKTSGKLTYGGGRYLFAEEPEEGDEVLIDFNLVTNPLCSYASIYNCIVPTLENKLPIAVTAGVKKYAHPDH